MHIRKRYLYWVATIAIAAMVSGCISFHRGYVFVSVAGSMDDAYIKTNQLIKNTEFKPLGIGDESNFENVYYGYRIVEKHERGQLNRNFSISVWKDTEEQQIVLIFGEANVRGFSKDGKSMVENFRCRLISEFGENNVSFGEDKETLHALWKRLHR